MGEIMSFPKTFKEFIDEYSFKDKEEIYTNGSDLIPVFRVEQAWDYYTNQITLVLDNIRQCYLMIKNNLYDIEDAIE